jgi:CBS domain containing-hemolysin-like protein/mannitol/fructose-specific phosphotransferase system IIA component (Ntr-type)
MGITAALIVSFLLLALNAFFVLAEFAVVKVRSSRLAELSRKGVPSAGLAHAITKDLDAHLSTIQLGITMASLGLGWLGEPALAKLIARPLGLFPALWGDVFTHSLAFAIAFVFITGGHVVIGELAPKSFAIRRPELCSLWCARPLSFFHRLFFIPMSVLNWLSNRFLRLFGISGAPSEYGYSLEEMRLIMSQAQEQGLMSLRRLLFFENLFDFSGTRLESVMIRGEAVAYLSRRRSREENLALLRERSFSRYPLCAAGLDTAEGYLHVRDLRRALLTPDAEPPDPFALRREVLRLDAGMPVEEALAHMQRARCPFALVKDAAGAVAGLVTMEDILEELVGEIHDEFDEVGAWGLEALVVPEGSDLRLEAADKAAALKSLLLRLHRAAGGFDPEAAWEALWRREQSFPSAMGRGVAFPHARLPGLRRPLIAIGRSVRGVDFEAPDGGPVRLVFLILTPLEEPSVQLRILAKLAALMSEEVLSRRLLSTRDVAGARAILRAFDQNLPDRGGDAVKRGPSR